MNQGMQDDFKRDGFISQLMTRLARLEAFEREFRLKQFGGGSAVSLVEDQLLVALAANVNFATIPTNAKHLHLKGYWRTNTVSTFEEIRLRYNGDAGANYDWIQISSNSGGSSGFNSFGDTSARLTWCAANSSPAGLFSTTELFMNNINEATGHRKGQGRSEDEENNTAGNYWTYDISHRWASTNPITSIDIFPGSGGSFVAGSRITLYAWL